MADALAQEVIRAWEKGESERGTWKTHWQDVANFMIPDRADYIRVNTPGRKRTQYIYDGTAVYALQMFASGLHSMLTSPTLRWFELRAEDDAINARQNCLAWMDDTAARMYSIFNGPRHNFASQSSELYLDTGSIGTAVMAVLESPRTDVLFSTRHLRECVFEENEEDRVDKLTRRWQYTAKQAYQAWGTAAGESVLKALENTPERQFWFLHRVSPRMKRDPQRADSLHKPFQSVYVSEADQSVIGESGFNEFPYLVPRFSKAPGEIYGRGLGMLALPDVRMLNEMAKTILKGAQKVVDPPLQLPDDGFMLPIRTTPGGLIFYRAGTRDLIQPLETKGNIPLGIEMLNALRTQIMRTFCVEWMNMPSDPSDPASSGKGVTATYVLQNRDEKMRLLSPMLARMQSEFLGPLIDRVFAIMWRQSVARRFGPGSLLSPPPPEMSGVPIRVEYVSPIAVAQRTSQIDTLSRLVQMTMQLMQVDPSAARTLDTDAILRLTARDLNAPALALKSPEAVQAQLEQEQQAQQELNAHAQISSLAGAAKDGTAAVANLAQAAQAGQPANDDGGQEAA